MRSGASGPSQVARHSGRDQVRMRAYYLFNKFNLFRFVFAQIEPIDYRTLVANTIGFYCRL